MTLTAATGNGEWMDSNQRPLPCSVCAHPVLYPPELHSRVARAHGGLRGPDAASRLCLDSGNHCGSRELAGFEPAWSQHHGLFHPLVPRSPPTVRVRRAMKLCGVRAQCGSFGHEKSRSRLRSGLVWGRQLRPRETL